VLKLLTNNHIDACYSKKILDGLDFILNHFQEPIFPRKIMTKDLGYQAEVFNKGEALEYFKNSKYKDCRINAYPSFTEYKGINRTPISFLMVDLDLKDFGGEEKDSSRKKGKMSLEKALNKASGKIKESIDGSPTVLWTGNGYHIYQPVSGFVLEEYETFYEFTKHLDKDLTSMFIQFAEEYFTTRVTMIMSLTILLDRQQYHLLSPLQVLRQDIFFGFPIVRCLVTQRKLPIFQIEGICGIVINKIS
jgi:hypothetical protein